MPLTLEEQGALAAVRAGFRIRPGLAYGAALERLIAKGLVERGPDGKPRLVEPADAGPLD